MKALSIRAPWWWCILEAGKDIENRDWPTRYRGPVLIHASKWWKQDSIVCETEDALECALEAGTYPPNGVMSRERMRAFGGHIVGRADIIDCVSKSESPWFFGDYGFVLADPVAFDKPIPFKGSLGLFDVPDELLEAGLS